MPRTTGLGYHPPAKKFLFLIPAHNEQELLPGLLYSLSQLDYPDNLYEIHIVADNCSDDTAIVGRENGAFVHERFNENARGKGPALQWLLNRIWAEDISHDAVVFLDADTVVSPNFLRVMDAKLAEGEQVIQAYYAVKKADRSAAVGLRWAALALLHYLRPLGRMKLGGSAGLKGNGMVFAAEVMKAHKWSASVTEDIELHMELLLAGDKVSFAPDAVVWAEMPSTFSRSRKQNVRWEQGRLEMMKKYIPSLFVAGIQQPTYKKAFPFFDAIMEHLIPPFSVLASLSLVSLFWAIIHRRFIQKEAVLSPSQKKSAGFGNIHFNLAILTIVGQVIYVLAGLLLAKAPRAIYFSFLAAPFYLLWKVWTYVLVLFNSEKTEWVRTVRNKE
jgi:cellulose synthase/poly-beta-1,6-N-acetylglucosamine synthase-like glycosyltransferase